MSIPAAGTPPVSLAVILLAAGDSRRYHGNKLLAPIDGLPMYQHALNWASRLPASRIVLVTQYQEILKTLCPPIRAVKNENSRLGISHSIQLGLEALAPANAYDAYLFSVCDQPWLRYQSVAALLEEYLQSPKGIASLAYGNRAGNPVIFDKKYLSQLRSLTGDKGGRSILNAYPEDIHYVQVKTEQELKDIDTRGDLH